MRKKFSWLVVFTIIIFSPYLATWIHQYNIKEIATLYTMFGGLLILGITLLTFIDIVNYYDWNDE